MKNNRLTQDVIKALYYDDIRFFEENLNQDNVDYHDGDERSILFYAIIEGKEVFVNFCISKSSKINSKDKMGWSPLHYAAAYFRKQIAEILIDNNADIEAKDNYGNTPLFRAVFESKGRGDIINLLLSKELILIWNKSIKISRNNSEL